MLDKFCGIVKRAHYFFAILLTVGGLCGVSYSLYEQYKEPKLQSWNMSKLVPKQDLPNNLRQTQIKPDYYKNLSNPGDLEGVLNDKNSVMIDLKGNTESATVQVSRKFSTLTKTEQDNEVNEIAEQLWGKKKHHDWVSMILLILLPLPIAGILHMIARWIFWGKIN